MTRKAKYGQIVRNGQTEPEGVQRYVERQSLFIPQSIFIWKFAKGKFLPYDYRNKSFVPFAENKELQAIAKAYARTTLGTMVNLSKTKALALGTVDKSGAFIPLEKSFKDVLDKAVIAVSTGTGDFNSEMQDVIRELGGSGMRIDYGGGVTRRVDSMVRQNLLWGVKQASIEYDEMIGEELGCDGIEVDWHSNPRPNHEFMQGKQFSLHGRKVIKGVVYEDAADALKALEEYGCLHFKTSIICGMSEPRYSPQELAKLNAENKREIEIDGVKKTGYGWKQTMRHLEREARITKEQMEIFSASGNNTKTANLRQKLKAINERYNKVAEGSGIKAQPGRMAYTKGVSKYIDIADVAKEPTRMSVPKSKNVLTSGGKSSKIRTGGKINDKNLHKVSEYEKQAKRYYQERINDDTDIIKVSSNTRFTEEEARQIKNHMMSDDILFKNGEIRKFDPDIDQALAWKRLIEGKNIKETDYLLLEHELEEAKIMKKMKIPYEEAHELANKKFNWEDEIEKIIDEDELY